MLEQVLDLWNAYLQLVYKVGPTPLPLAPVCRPQALDAQVAMPVGGLGSGAEKPAKAVAKSRIQDRGPYGSGSGTAPTAGTRVRSPFRSSAATSTRARSPWWRHGQIGY